MDSAKCRDLSLLGVVTTKPRTHSFIKTTKESPENCTVKKRIISLIEITTTAIFVRKKLISIIGQVSFPLRHCRDTL